jgi:hypothetical protein
LAVDDPPIGIVTELDPGRDVGESRRGAMLEVGRLHHV